MSYMTEAPHWQKDAIPTQRGWVHPKTGELLVAIKLDMSMWEKKDEKAAEESVVLETPAETTTELPVEAVEALEKSGDALVEEKPKAKRTKK